MSDENKSLIISWCGRNRAVHPLLGVVGFEGLYIFKTEFGEYRCAIYEQMASKAYQEESELKIMIQTDFESRLTDLYQKLGSIFN